LNQVVKYRTKHLSQFPLRAIVSLARHASSETKPTIAPLGLEEVCVVVVDELLAEVA
jgi:hypothetical protein